MQRNIKFGQWRSLVRRIVPSFIAIALAGLAFLSLALLPKGANSEVDMDRTATYAVQFEAIETRLAHVQAEMSLSQGTIKMLAWGHPWLPQGWATFVENLHVTDGQGNELATTPVAEDGWGSWTVDAEDGTRVTLTYDVRFNHDQYDWFDAGGQDSRPSYSHGGLYLVSRALFFYSPYAVDEATVELTVPEEWNISAPWPEVEGEPRTYHVDSWSSLVSNMIVVGDHLQRTFAIDEMIVTLAADPSLEDHVNDFEETLRTQLDEYTRLFEGAPNVTYLVAIREADEIEGEAFYNSFSQIMLRDRIDRRRPIWANVLGHELFHYWNGANTLIGVEQARVEWFGEGFTEYYASLTSFRTGILDEETYHNKLARYFARYHISKRIWPADPTSLVEAGNDKPANWLYLYGGGATIALILDIEIRDLTNAERGLSDVMRLMNQRFGDTETPYDVPDVLQAVNEVSGSDFSGFFDRYVLGADEMPDIETTLAKAGLMVDQYGDEFYVYRNPTPTARQDAVYNAIFVQPW